MADYSVTYDQLDALLQGLDPNTADTPYEIEITEVTRDFLLGGGDNPSSGTLRYVLCQNPNKYVSLTWGANAISLIEGLSDNVSMYEQNYWTAINFLRGATNLVSINISHFTGITFWYVSFGSCTSLKTLDLSNLTQIKYLSNVLQGCISLESVNMSGLSSLHNTDYLFNGCFNLRVVNMAGCDNIETSISMFYGCFRLTSITLPEMSKNMDVTGMFSNCSSLKEIHNWTVPVGANYGYVTSGEDLRCFGQCSSLQAIYTSPSDTPPQESSWRAWDIKKDTANSRSEVTIYGTSGNPVTVQVPSSGSYTLEASAKVDELLFSGTSAITQTHIDKMLATQIPITGNTNALDPTQDNFVMLAKDRNAIKTNITTDVIEAGNKLPPTSEAVRAAIGGAMPVGIIISYPGSVAPDGWHLCIGETKLRSDYPSLMEWVVLNDLIGDGKLFGAGDGTTTFDFPDLRELVLVGAGQSARPELDATGHAHDVYAVGEFKDDQMQGHTHSNTLRLMSSTGSNSSVVARGNNEHRGDYNPGGVLSSYRTGTTTHGKQIGMNYIIKI